MRALVFAHYDKHDVVDDYVLYLLRTIRPHYDMLIFVSTARLASVEIAKASRLSDKVIVRNNVGYDFGSWREGYESLNEKICTSITFMNDSCYGPLSEFGIFLERGAALNAGVWGAACNYQIKRHLQSFFMCFEESCIRKGTVRRFWRTVEPCASKMELILRFEVGMTSFVEADGTLVRALVDIEKPSEQMRKRVIFDNNLSPVFEKDKAFLVALCDNSPNPMQLYWKETLNQGCPFLKIEVMRDNPLGADRRMVLAEIASLKWYDCSLITSHLRRTLQRRYAEERLSFDCS